MRYSKKKSRRNKVLMSQLERFKATLTHDNDGDRHRPVVNIFGAKTGRDTTSGNALNLIPKHHWKGLLSPLKGYCYVLLDYEQQEPMIVAQKANCTTLVNLYEQGDIYELLIKTTTNDELKRSELKKLMLMHLYGAGIKRIAQELSQPESSVVKWLLVLKKIISPIDYYLDGEAFKAKRKGEIRSLDWRMGITQEIKTLTIRNWPIQATGADIMRRACFNLDMVKLPVLLTNHDSFLVQLEKDKFDHQLRQAKQALTDASAKVLDGFQLKVKVEMKLPSKEKR
ncbi:DNA polymerase [Psychromonas ossibalaenae]|uniref:DNA polymerase n=1 Tax=Psychromonas ossibalaenae TaxID=444922 RepID=UPI0009FB9DA6|nr:DNA polymerase [Psychromonas ossibalaenae]